MSASVVDLPLVIVLDDDPLLRSALGRLLLAAGLEAELYSSGAELLSQAKFDRPGCLILDVGMPCMSGIEVQKCLKERNIEIPLIFVSSSSDMHVAVAAMREGAADFIEKPFDPEHLLSRVRQVIARNCAQRLGNLERSEVLRRIDLLTPREAAVLELIVEGNTSKEMARTLGASHRTIDIHRHHIMEKMAAFSLAGLVRMHLLARSKSSWHTVDQMN